jgi:ribosome maturation factor RimP
MRQAPANIRNVIEPVVESLGYELVGVEFLPQGHHALLRVYIDAEKGITLDDCQRTSHQLSGVLDVEDVVKGQYNLEISSPGLDRPLFTEAHFERFSGHEAKLKLGVPLEGRKKLKGVLQGIDGDKVMMEVEGEVLAVPFSTIEKANLVPEL